MVANSPIERVGPGQLDYLLNRLNDLERRLDQQGARSSFPFSIGHQGVRDFSIEPSSSGDGTADIFMGNGAGGKLIQILTDTTYGTKIFVLRDQNGRAMMSTDAAAGYGLGVPSYPFQYAGFESATLTGATSQGTASEIARGVNYVYNPATYVNVRIRLSSATSETVKVFAQWRDFQGNLVNTADQTLSITGGTIAVRTAAFGKLWDADDMNGTCSVFIKAWVQGGTPGNVSLTASYNDGYGISKGFYDTNSPGWAV